MKTIQVSDETWALAKRLALMEGVGLGLFVGRAVERMGLVLTPGDRSELPEPEGLKRGPRRAKKTEGSAPEAEGSSAGVVGAPVARPAEGTDAWLSMRCGRCGHTRRVHFDFRKDVATGCALCAAACRGFEEPE